MYFEKILPNNWIGVRRNFQKIDSYLFGPTAEPTFNSITLAGLTASRLVWTDADKAFESKDLVDLVTGTANEIDITDDGDGSITVGLVNPLITAKGGTGLATLTDHGLLLGSGTGAVTPLAEATNGQIPIGSTGNDPVLATITGTAKRVTVANTAGTITLSGPQDLDTVDSPTFAGATIGSLGGIVLATAGVLSAITNNSAHWDTAYSHSQLASGNPHSVTPTELGLVIGTNTQAWDASLDSIAALTYASASFIKLTAEDTYAVRTIAETKSDLSLNLVENTALSSWAGSGNITTVGALASGSIAAGFTEIAVDFTAAKCTDATADNTAGNETSHADVVVDGDFASNGILNRTGAGAYSILVLGSDVQAYHANLAAIVAGSWTGANSITTLGTIATGTWEATDVGIAHGGTGQSTAQAAINALSAVGAATNEHVLTKDTGTGNAIWKAAAGGGGSDAFTVKVDAAATAGYLGAANNDGILRATDGIAYSDGGDYITLSLDSAYLPTFAGMNITGPSFFEPGSIDANSDNFDVSGISVLYVDTSGNSVRMGGFSGGSVGQILFVLKSSINNSMILEHYESTGTQKIMTDDGHDITFTSRGGCMMFCSGTYWYTITGAG